MEATGELDEAMVAFERAQKLGIERAQINIRNVSNFSSSHNRTRKPSRRKTDFVLCVFVGGFISWEVRSWQRNVRRKRRRNRRVWIRRREERERMAKIYIAIRGIRTTRSRH